MPPISVVFIQTHTDGTIPDAGTLTWVVDNITQEETRDTLTITFENTGSHYIYTTYKVGGVEYSGAFVYYVGLIGCNLSVITTAEKAETIPLITDRLIDSLLILIATSTDNRVRTRGNVAGSSAEGTGDVSDTVCVIAFIHDGLDKNYTGKGEISGTKMLIAVQSVGQNCNIPGMFTERDRVPRIGVHQTVSGYGIPEANIIISGKLGISTAVKTDGRGVWWSYLPMDDYSKADIRSFTDSGKVYELLKQVEREEGYIWDEIMKRIGKSGAGQIMISRQV
jgi:hypothetical protein